MSQVTELEQRGAFSAALAAIEERGGSPYRDQHREPGDAAAHQHGQLLWRLARFDRAEHLLTAALAHRRATLGADHLDTLATAERLAAVAHYRGDCLQGAAGFRAVIAALDRVVGPDHLRAGIARRNLAACLRDGGGPGAAGTLAEAARVIVARAGRGSPDHVAVLKVEALLVLGTGDHRHALTLADDAVTAAIACHGREHPFTAGAELTLASALLEGEQPERARATARHARAVFSAAYGDHPLTGLALDRLAVAEAELGDLDAAVLLGRRADALFSQTYPREVLAWFSEVGNRLLEAGRFDDVIELADGLLARPLARASRKHVEGFRGAAIDWIAAALEPG